MKDLPSPKLVADGCVNFKVMAKETVSETYQKNLVRPIHTKIKVEPSIPSASFSSSLLSSACL
jgi:hypothetical protein